MDRIVNFGIPHVGEQIFENIDTPGLIQCHMVSKKWKLFAETILMQRFRGFRQSLFDIFDCKETVRAKVFEILLECSRKNEIDFNATNHRGSTLFTIACGRRYLDVIKIFLDYSDNENIKMDLNARSQVTGVNAFINACLDGHTDVVKLLLD